MSEKNYPAFDEIFQEAHAAAHFERNSMPEMRSASVIAKSILALAIAIKESKNETT